MQIVPDPGTLTAWMDETPGETAMRFTLGTLPSLDDVRIASPCSVGWRSMAGDDRVRFCSQCQKHVYNLSAMNTDEATALLRQKEGRLCVRFYRRWDGTMKTADCPTGLRQFARHPWRWVASSVVAVLAVVLPGLGCGNVPCQGAPLPPPTSSSSQKSSPDKPAKDGQPAEPKAAGVNGPGGAGGSAMPPSATPPTGASCRKAD